MLYNKKLPHLRISKVEPIRETSKIRDIRTLLIESKKFKYLLLFVLGINTGLRISDILKTQVKDLWAEDGTPKDEFMIREQKTGKANRIFINNKLKEAMALYREEYPTLVKRQDNFVFFSTYTTPRGREHIQSQVVRN